jgi:hypothetical protein
MNGPNYFTTNERSISMTTFNIEQLTDQPDRIYVEIDRRFNIVIEQEMEA